jgi:hypothetical protein
VEVPVFMVAETINQCEQQGWNVRFVLFVGHKVPRIAAPNQQAIPIYNVLSCRDYEEGETPVPPEIKFETVKPINGKEKN